MVHHIWAFYDLSTEIKLDVWKKRYFLTFRLLTRWLPKVFHKQDLLLI